MPGQLSALAGPRGILRLYPWLVAPALLAGEGIFIADGGNSFNPYDFTEIAAYAGRPPGELLGRIQISRAFTCHQMRARVRRLGGFARRARARVIVLPGLLESYYDEALPAREVGRTWRATLDALRRLAGEDIVKLDGNENPYAPSPRALEAVASYAHYNLYPDPAQRALRRSLAGAAGRAVDCRQGEDGRWRLRIAKPKPAPAGSGALGALWKVG